MKAWGSAGVLLTGLLVGTGAGAAEDVKQEAKQETPSRQEGWKFRLEANTDFPLGVGGRVAAVSPWRLYLTTSVDVLLPAYVQAGNGIATAAGLYDQRKADFIENAVKNSVAWRTHLGWQPFATSGFYVEAGYGLLALGGQTNPEEALTSLLYLDPPGGEATERQYRVRALVHQLDLELGWRWKLAEHWSLRAGLGGTVTLDSNSRVEPQEGPGDSLLVEAFSRLAENKIDTTFERYGYLPTLSLSVGYTF